MQLTIYHAKVDKGHETAIMEHTEAAKTLPWADYNVIAIAGEIVRNAAELDARVAMLEAQGLTETEVVIVPQMQGG